MSKKNEFKEKNKKEVVNKKNHTFEIVGFIVAVVLIGSFLLIISKEKGNTKYNHIKEVSYTEYKKMIEKDDFTIVLIARDDCPHCVKYKPFMNQALDDYNLEAIYVNVGEMNLGDYNELHDNVSILKDSYNDGDPVIPTPNTIIFKNGVEIDSETGNVGYNGFLKLLARSGVIG